MATSPHFTAATPRYQSSMNRLLLIFVTFGSLVPAAHLGIASHRKGHWQAEFFRHTKRSIPAKRGPPEDWEGKVPLVVTNKCETTIWPGIATQSGTGPGTGGFELAPGKNKTLWVAPDWQGRVWGRTNCTVNGESCACKTGDCFSKLDCEFSVSLRHPYSLMVLFCVDVNIAFREQLLRHLQSSTWPEELLGCKPFTTYL